MVVSKDDLFFREPRPQMVRSKSVGAITRPTHGLMDSRKHKKTPYSSSRNLRKKSGLRVWSSVTNSSDIPTNREISDRNCDSTNSSWSILKTFPSAWGLENSSSVSTDRYASSCLTPTSNNLERRLSVESRSFKGNNLLKEIDYSSNCFISLSAKNRHQPLCVATGAMTEDRSPIFAGQLPGQLKNQSPQLMNNMTYVNSQEEICKLQADSSSTGLATMENYETEFLASENNDSSCQHKLDDCPSMKVHHYSNHGTARCTRRPLVTCNLQDNQLNIQRLHRTGSTVDSFNARQLDTCQHKQCIPGQMHISGAKVSPTYSSDENVTNQVKLTFFDFSQDDVNQCDADQDIHSAIFNDECLDCTHQNRDQKNLLTDDKACKLTDDMNVLTCNDESNHQLSYSLRRRDTVLIQQDKIDDDNADNGDFDSFFESLKKFLCQKVPDDDDSLQEANNREDESGEAEVSYKNLLNCPPRYQCALCDSNLEVVPFQQYDGDCENEYFPFFVLEDSASRTEQYCPQCRCLRSIYCPE